jgi:steroid 5-alpha reductase family enzyme
MDFLTLPTWATIAGVYAAIMIVWAVQLRTRDATAVDVCWAFGVGAVSVCALAAGDGDIWRRALLALLISWWSLRLGGHLLIDRVIRSDEEDGRYRSLREEKGSAWPWWSLGFFHLQLVFVLIFAAPALILSHDPRPLGIAAGLAVAVWLAGQVVESLADRQLARWKRDPANRGHTCRAGLWRYSRHPNYFGEWLQWVGIALLAVPGPYWWLLLVHPPLILALLWYLTGIPYTEAQAKRKRPDYQDYQDTTAPLIPWFPKTDHSSGDI